MTGAEVAGAVVLVLGIAIGFAVAPSAGSVMADRREAEAAWQQRVAAVSTARTPWWFVGRRARLLLEVGAVLLIIGATTAVVTPSAGTVLGGITATVGLIMVLIGELSRHWPALVAFRSDD